MFKWFIFGYLLSSLISTVGVGIWDLKGCDDTYLAIFCGHVMWVWIGVARIIEKLQFYYKHKGLNSIIVDKDTNTIYYCSPKIVNALLDDETKNLYFAHFKDYSGIEGWDRNLWKEEHIHMDLPSVRYAPKEIWSRYPEYKA